MILKLLLPFNNLENLNQHQNILDLVKSKMNMIQNFFKNNQVVQNCHLEYKQSFFNNFQQIERCDVKTISDYFLLVYMLVVNLMRCKFYKYIKEGSQEVLKQKVRSKTDIHSESILYQKLNGYCLLSLKEYFLKAKKIQRNTIGHKLYYLIDLFEIRNRNSRIMQQFLNVFIDLPFETEQLDFSSSFLNYVQQDYQQCVDINTKILQNSRFNNNRLRQIFIQMNSMIHSQKLNLHQTAIKFSLTNLQEYAQNLNQFIKKEQIYLNIAINYISLAKSQLFYSDQQDAFLKALEYLKMCEKIQKNNFIMNYYLALVNANIQENKEAMYYVELSIRQNNNYMNSHILLVLLMTAENNTEKALLVLNQLLQQNGNHLSLNIIKCLILVEICQQKAENQVSQSKDVETVKSTIKKMFMHVLDKEQNQDSNYKFDDVPTIREFSQTTKNINKFWNYKTLCEFSCDIFSSLKLSQLQNLVSLLDHSCCLTSIYESRNPELSLDQRIQILEHSLIQEPNNKKVIQEMTELLIENDELERALEMALILSDLDIRVAYFYLGTIYSFQEQYQLSNQYLKKSYLITLKSPVVSYSIFQHLYIF